MTSFIVFAGMNIRYIIDEIQVQKPYEHNTSAYVGSRGSTTTPVSSEGRVISFKSICKADELSETGRDHRIRDYKDIVNIYAFQSGVLTSPSSNSCACLYFLSSM